MNFKSYLSENYQEIEDVRREMLLDDDMEGFMMTDEAVLDSLTDYANEFGDQSLLELFEKWKKDKMGDSAIGCRIRVANILNSVSEKMSKLEPNMFSDKREQVSYEVAKTDCMMIVLKETAKL